MQIYSELTHISADSGTAVALGYFDGVHLGHRAVISEAVAYARDFALESAVFTFSLPRNSAVKGKGILSAEQKRERIKALGVQHYLCPSFAQFCALSASAFVDDILVGVFGAKAVFCGDNFTFGTHKSGNVAVLKELCRERGIKVHCKHLYRYDERAVSSSRIRAALKAGDITGVNAMLGEAYVIDSEVVHGQGLGAKLGVPTINQVFSEDMQIPKSGVYISRVLVEGTYYPAATGIGSRPTVNGHGITCESFIIGLDKDLYGAKVRLELGEYLHDIKRYDNTDELKNMIINASEKAAEYYAARDK